MYIPPQNSSSSTQPSGAQFTAALTSALSDADTSAATTTANLKLVHQAKLSQLTRKAAVLTAQYGASDSRTVAAQAAVTAGNAVVARIAVASQQTDNPEEHSCPDAEQKQRQRVDGHSASVTRKRYLRRRLDSRGCRHV